MRFKNFDLNLLVVFDTIYREGNLTRASEALSITQPAVSNALMRLRQSFGDELFVRSGKRMAPTPVAQNLIDPIQSVLAQLTDVISSPAEFDPSISTRTFNLSISDVRASFLMPRLSEFLASRAPNIRLRCFRVDRKEIEADLASGRLDLAIDVPQLLSPTLESLELPKEEYVCALRRNHPLADGTLTLESFMSLNHITVSGRRRGGGYVEAALKQIGQRVSSPLRLQNYPPAFQVLAATDFALCAPRHLAVQHDVTIKPLPFEISPIQPRVFWHRAAENDDGIIWLRSLINDVAYAESESGYVQEGV